MTTGNACGSNPAIYPFPYPFPLTLTLTLTLTSSGMWNEKLMQLHRPLMNYLHAHERVTIHSMAEQNLESQQDQIDHCGALVARNLVGGKPPATWVGNWDVDEMAVGDRPHDSAKVTRTRTRARTLPPTLTLTLTPPRSPEPEPYP